MNNVNKEIEINAFTFTNKQEFKSIPRTITVDDQRYSFIDSGLRYLVQQGQHLIRLFDMTDGQSVYRLKNEDDQWTLVSIKHV
ncbi:MAG TPA: hypothetical protein VLF90_00180 [Patescibacteria group bacterium]|nr:hypothetical protein [Patescibacteria group bacterium]